MPRSLKSGAASPSASLRASAGISLSRFTEPSALRLTLVCAWSALPARSAARVRRRRVFMGNFFNRALRPRREPGRIIFRRAMIVDRDGEVVFLDEFVEDREPAEFQAPAKLFQTRGADVVERAAQGGLVGRDVDHAGSRDGDAGIGEFLHSG